MFPFLAFATAGQAQSAPASSVASINYFAAPWATAPLPKPEPTRPRDFGDFYVDFLREAISFWARHYETLGNRSHLLFTQIAAALAFERAARETSVAVTQAYAAFGLKPPPSAIPQWSQPQLLAPLTSFAPLSSFASGTALAPWAAFNPWLSPALAQNAFNPWGAVAESFNVWTKIWQPAAPQKTPAPQSVAAPVPAKPFTATVTAPGGFNWAFSFGV